jgi:hypothetical protein
MRDQAQKSAYNKAYYQKYKERLRSVGRKTYLRHRDVILADRKENWAKYKSIELKSNFGITYDEYSTMLQNQNGVCAICFQPETTKSRTKGKIRLLAVDHNHVTGKVRGLLCSGCNQAIGLLKDDPLRGDSLAKYLRERNG